MSELSGATREAVRDLVLVLADSKRLLGMRYADWILGAPELEAGIACASMAQDEWGHGRLLYALLKDFGEDVDRLEHGREPGEYCSLEVLDRPPGDWAALVAVNAFVDRTLSVQCEALRGCSYLPLAQRVDKLLEEERFHDAHGAAWLRRLADGGEAARSAIRYAADAIVPALLRWFGPDSERARALCEAGVVARAGSGLRTRFLERVGPFLDALDMDAAAVGEPHFDGFDEATRRVSRAGPDAETIARVRGDRNRVLLLD